VTWSVVALDCRGRPGYTVPSEYFRRSYRWAITLAGNRIRKRWIMALALGAAGLLSGCVERRYVIYTDPPGAIVIRNGQVLGPTPVDDYYIYYGTYHFTIFADGYETLQVDQEICSPWYEYPGLDFISENLVPYPIVDRREFHFKLEPRRVPDAEQLLNQAGNLRSRGLALPSVPYDRLPISAPAQPIPVNPPPPRVVPQSPGTPPGT
jgi:hypothetical protein